MQARWIGRERLEVLSFKWEREAHGRIKWIRVCREIGSGRESKRCTCLEAVEYGQKGRGHL